MEDRKGLFEIGLVYRKGQRLFIAVSDSMLVSCMGGKAIERRPTQKYDVVRAVTVEEIATKWGVTLAEFDQLIGEHLGPVKNANLKLRPRGTRRRSGAEEHYWKHVRTSRIARPTV